MRNLKLYTPLGFVPEEYIEKFIELTGLKWDEEYQNYIILSEERSGDFFVRDENKNIKRSKDTGEPFTNFQTISRPFKYYQMEKAMKKVDQSSSNYWLLVFKEYEKVKTDLLPDIF